MFPVRPPCMRSGGLSPGPHGPGRCPSSLPRLTPAARRGHRTSFDVSVRTRALRGACSQRFVTVVDAVPRANVHRIRNCPRSTPCACPCVLSSALRVLPVRVYSHTARCAGGSCVGACPSMWRARWQAQARALTHTPTFRVTSGETRSSAWGVGAEEGMANRSVPPGTHTTGLCLLDVGLAHSVALAAPGPVRQALENPVLFKS